MRGHHSSFIMMDMPSHASTGPDCREHLRKRTAKHKRCLHECINGIHTRAVGRWLHSLDAGSNRARRASHASRSFAAVAALGPLVSMDTVHTANRSALGSWEASRAFASVTTRIQEQCTQRQMHNNACSPDRNKQRQHIMSHITRIAHTREPVPLHDPLNGHLWRDVRTPNLSRS